MVPPLVSFVANNDEVTSEDLSALEHIIAAAAPSGPELIKKFKSKAPSCVYREGDWWNLQLLPMMMEI